MYIADIVCVFDEICDMCGFCCCIYLTQLFRLQLLKDMDLQHTGGIGEMEFVHAISKVPEFGTTFSFRL